MSRDVDAGGGAPVAELRVDGGASVNDLLMQFQADLLGIPVVRPKVIETTALGAAYLAGLSVRRLAGTDELASHWQVDRTFHPTMSRDRAGEWMRRWSMGGSRRCVTCPRGGRMLAPASFARRLDLRHDRRIRSRPRPPSLRLVVVPAHRRTRAFDQDSLGKVCWSRR